MSRYHGLRIAQIRHETKECVSIALEVPEVLKEEFAFKPGQYLNCRVMIDGEEVRKSYSICSVPGDPHLVVAVKLVYGGKMSTYIHQQLKAGDMFDVTVPEGKFVLPDSLPEDALLLFFAAGSGITPVVSIIRYFLEHHASGQAVLFYSNKSSDTVIFRETLEGLKNQYMDRFSIYHILTRELTGIDLLSGRVDQDKCHAFGKYFFRPSEVTNAFVCGPELMILDVKSALQEMGVEENRIRFELFGTGAFYSRKKEEIRVPDQSENIQSRVTIRVDGHEADFQIGYLDEPVLDVAMRSGLDLPYSCKGGVCSTCRALVVEGKVHMDIQYGLEPDEIDAGYVLTCQAHPRSERLILDYDIL